MMKHLPTEPLQVLGLQIGCFAPSIRDNLTCVLKKLEQVPPRQADLIVLPELINTYYHYEIMTELSEGEEERFLDPIRQIAAEKTAYILAGSLAVRQAGKLYNRSFLLSPQGETVTTYDKMHLIALLGETDHFTPGRQTATAEIKGWKLGIAICFDLRFAELFLNYALDGCHLVVLPACWPHERANHWRSLHLARAQECQAFFLGVNAGGFNGKGKTYGGSILATPDSVPQVELPWGSEGTIATTITSAGIARQKQLYDLMVGRKRPPL
ncbi:MAG: hypothetical protein B1H03_01135 [Planctomycetales bacterium 4484_113]|nr:MAG: hypothetical protein B1H03_01135 [Planctomycetales bacterium 4484_113]